ncbi:unnamed protein product [Calypogeia fissa]
MYLSHCRFFLTGFESVEMRRLVHMVLNGGGTRYMEFNERVTHVVIGKPSERELKDFRQYAMWGTVHIVMPVWLEECARQRREVAAGTPFKVPPALLSNDSHWKAERNKTVPLDDKKSEVESMRARVMPRKVWNASEAQPHTGAVFATFQDKDSSRRPLKTLLPNPASHLRNGLHDSKSASSQVSKIQTPGFSKPLKGRGQLPQLPLKRILTSGEGCERSRCEPFAIPPTTHVNSEGRGSFEDVKYVGRAPSAATATGFGALHSQEQQELIHKALQEAPIRS